MGLILILIMVLFIWKFNTIVSHIIGILLEQTDHSSSQYGTRSWILRSTKLGLTRSATCSQRGGWRWYQPRSSRKLSCVRAQYDSNLARLHIRPK